MGPVAPSPPTNRSATVSPVGGIFSPQRPVLRLDNHAYSPAAWRLIAEAAGRLGSFADAAFALALAGLPVSPQHVRTLAREVGVALTQQRDAQAATSRTCWLTCRRGKAGSAGRRGQSCHAPTGDGR
jgi:hypothetical protein